MPESLYGADGRVVATFVRDETGGTQWAILTSLRPAVEVAPAVLAQFAGHRVVTEDDDLVPLLVAGGGRVQRRAHDYAYDLADVPPEWAETPAPQGFRVTRDFDAARLSDAHDAAYPLGHPDHEPGLDHVDDLRSMIGGQVIGPLVREASWQADDETGPCGAILVVDRPPADERRTWVVDVFVHPRHHGRGLGAVLLRRSLAGARAAGYRTMGLVVSDGNPARYAYDAVGFRNVRSGTNLDLP